LFLFPRWANLMVRAAVPLALGGGMYTAVLAVYALNPVTTDVGYAPVQPVEYSHALHAGDLGIDCRYCHTTVENAGFAAIPPTQTCMNCHSHIFTDSEKLEVVFQSQETGLPIEWVKVHDLPDYAYFDHSAHINKGVSCVECHGRVDKMEVVEQVETLSMAWCLDCHRNPGPRLRPPEHVTNLDWHPPVGEEREAQIAELLERYEIKSPRQLTDCSTCHR
jgi:menaquinone reductase, multiheme cytochrome c subunit